MTRPAAGSAYCGYLGASQAGPCGPQRTKYQRDAGGLGGSHRTDGRLHRSVERQRPLVKPSQRQLPGTMVTQLILLSLPFHKVAMKVTGLGKEGPSALTKMDTRIFTAFHPAEAILTKRPLKKQCKIMLYSHKRQLFRRPF